MSGQPLGDRSTRHDCLAIRLAAAEYGADKINTAHLAHVQRGPFGLGIMGVPLNCQFPDRDKSERYIPLATHCPYCGEEVPVPECMKRD